MAVVRVDTYGHGADPVARAALDAGAHWLGVAHVSEALQLRTTIAEARILAWLHTPAIDFAAALIASIDLACSGWELGRLGRRVRRIRPRVRCSGFRRGRRPDPLGRPRRWWV